MKILMRRAVPEFLCIICTSTEFRQQAVMAAINTRDLTKNMVRVKSSNVWSYGINIRKKKDKFGDVIAQFKGNEGGPGDIYIYYDVPIQVYRRWASAPSKGHFFWQYIRNNYKYAKLTGDRKTKLRNGVNSDYMERQRDAEDATEARAAKREQDRQVRDDSRKQQRQIRDNLEDIPYEELTEEEREALEEMTI